MTARRISIAGARIDRSRPLAFTFDGVRYSGFAGDTLASALLAAGAPRMLARSFKYGRPRGIVGSGIEEPNALVQLETGAGTVPNLKATEVELYDGLVAGRTSGWPSLHLDLKALAGRFGRFMPAGFYYKTFQSRRMWPHVEKIIRWGAGYGRAPRDPDPERYDHLHRHVDVLVVGGGAAGLVATLMAGRAGLDVLLVDEGSEPGGWLLSTPGSVIGGRPAPEWLAWILGEISRLPNVRVLPRTTAFGLHDGRLVHAVERLQDHLPLAARDPETPRQRLHHIRAGEVVLATGAIERPLVFSGNDVPGVMTASALTTYANRYGVLCGGRLLILTNNDTVYRGAADLARLGAAVTVVDTRAEVPLACERMARGAGCDVIPGHGIAGVSGRHGVTGARLVRLDPDRNVAVGEGPSKECDVIASSGGLTPCVHLYCHDGGRPVWDESRQAFVVPGDGRADEGIHCVGAVTGAFRLGEALESTARTMERLLEGKARSGKPSEAREIAVEEPPYAQPRKIVRVPDGRQRGEGKTAFIDLQNDVTVADIHLAVRENYRSIEHVKRYTALGFGTDQGKLSGVNGFAVAAEALGRPIPEVGTTTYRPPYTPVTFGALAGPHAAETFEPVRSTPMHPSHVAAGAIMEPVGQWLRPRYFPRAGEEMGAAVLRECRAARVGVAIMDASTLGKIDIRGRDARELLDRVYTSAWGSLRPGRSRYGLMLDENGMLMDDGVTSCLSDGHYLMTTTTGGAARVFSWLERWHQTEWPDLDVYLTSVTDHWATAALVGPRSREVLAGLVEGIDLSRESMRYMDWREGKVAGVAARVFRVSFSGELAYEIYVEASYGLHVWEALLEAGRPHAITPYGTETMHVLRAEKGYVIVGQDTDGSVTPIDLGLGWAVDLEKPYSFIGQRSLSRVDTARPDRKQLVGLLTEDPQVVLREGAQILSEPNEAPPAHMLGHVTSGYMSAELGHSIALALVADGHARRAPEGRDAGRDRLFAWADGRAHKVRVVSPVFLDPKGARQNV